MAKSGKKTFRESTADYAALAARIAERRFEPLYLLMGDEPYFIDSLTARLADAILPPTNARSTRRSSTAKTPTPEPSSTCAAKCR